MHGFLKSVPMGYYNHPSPDSSKRYLHEAVLRASQSKSRFEVFKWTKVWFRSLMYRNFYYYVVLLISNRYPKHESKLKTGKNMFSLVFTVIPMNSSETAHSFLLAIIKGEITIGNQLNNSNFYLSKEDNCRISSALGNIPHHFWRRMPWASCPFRFIYATLNLLCLCSYIICINKSRTCQIQQNHPKPAKLSNSRTERTCW